jgi:hypothetical protein
MEKKHHLNSWNRGMKRFLHFENKESEMLAGHLENLASMMNATFKFKAHIFGPYNAQNGLLLFRSDFI